ncbi:hypothetical protein TorRG33x02_167360, partial [Trema orientale]
EDEDEDEEALIDLALALALAWRRRYGRSCVEGRSVVKQQRIGTKQTRATRAEQRSKDIVRQRRTAPLVMS